MVGWSERGKSRGRAVQSRTESSFGTGRRRKCEESRRESVVLSLGVAGFCSARDRGRWRGRTGEGGGEVGGWFMVVVGMGRH